MRTIDGTVLTTLSQARTFINGHLPQLGTLESAGYRQKLNDVIDALGQHAVDQEAADRMCDSLMARQRALIAALRLNHMRPIVMIAGAKLREIPEFNSFRMPVHRIRTMELAIAGEAMAKVARPYAPVFIEAGLAPDFAEQLEAAAESLRQCVTDRETSGTKKSAASAGLRTEASRGRKVLRVLSSLIEPRLANDQPLLAGWRSARHIRKPPTPRPVVFPLLGLTLLQGSATSGSSTSPELLADSTTAVPKQLALPPALAQETVVSQDGVPQSSAFSRAVQIITDDGGAEATLSGESAAP